LKLRIVTYNVHRCVGTDGVEDPARIAHLLGGVEPDVVCLQEVVVAARDDGAPDQPAVIADALGMREGAVGLNCERRRGVYGNATFSRLTVEAHENLDLTLRLNIPRGGLYTRIALPSGRPLHLWNVHLGLGGHERPFQVRRVLAHLAEVVRGNEPVLVLGDFNDWRNRLARGALARSGFRSLGGDGRKDPGPATFPSRAPLGALDKVFAAGPVVLRSFHVGRTHLARVASDHLPVIADLEIRPA
jgi:endonuclease/exonuclease/phosphatase family metal-dependent hydrolase